MSSDETLKSALLEYVKAICDFLNEKTTEGTNPKELFNAYVANLIVDDEELIARYPINTMPEAERYFGQCDTQGHTNCCT